MPRQISGVFLKSDRVRATPGTNVRVALGGGKQSIRAILVGLGTSDLVITAAHPFQVGAEVSVAITLPGRYIEFEVPGVVEWENGATFGVSLTYLTARQAYGVTLARELLRAPATVATPRRAARR